jgi:hypothetical protein
VLVISPSKSLAGVPTPKGKDVLSPRGGVAVTRSSAIQKILWTMLLDSLTSVI